MALPVPFYQDALVTLYNGDCRDILPNFGPGSFTWGITDPPLRDVVDLTPLNQLLAQVVPLLQACCLHTAIMMTMAPVLGSGPNRNNLVASRCSFSIDGGQPIVGNISDPDMKLGGWASVLTTRSVAAGQSVVDPFAGAGGWLLLAAKRAGVQATGIELDPNYCAQVAARLAAG